MLYAKLSILWCIIDFEGSFFRMFAINERPRIKKPDVKTITV